MPAEDGHIYEAVLDHGVAYVEEFAAFLQSKRQFDLNVT